MLNFIFWFIFSSSTYRSVSLFRVEVLQDGNSNFSTYISQTYQPYDKANYLLADWLKSATAYQQLINQIDMKEIYKKGDLFSKFGGVASFFINGDRSEWKYFRNHLSIRVNNESSLIKLCYTSYDTDDSQKVVKTLLILGNNFLQSSYQNNEIIRINYINELSLKISKSLQEIETKIQNYIAHDISIYPKESYLASINLKNGLERKLFDLSTAFAAFKELNTKSPLKDSFLLQQKSLQNDINKLTERNLYQLQQYEGIEELLRKKNFFESLYNALKEKQYMFMKTDYMKHYKINVISFPSHFIERSGPYKIKGFLLSFFIISIIYWLIKE